MLDSSQSRSAKKKQILDDSKNDGSIQSNMASSLSESVSPQSRSRIDSRGYAQKIPNEKLRGQLRAMATDAVASWKTNGIPSSLRLTDGIKRLAEQLVVRTSADSSHVGWTMVTVVSEFWRDQLSKTGPGKKLLLLPDCSVALHVQNRKSMPEFSFEVSAGASPHPRSCGPGCVVTVLEAAAIESGWGVASSSQALSVISGLLEGRFDAVLGVAKLEELEKAFSMLPVFAFPIAAVPMDAVNGNGISHSPGCLADCIDADWVLGLLGVGDGSSSPACGYLPLLREASTLFLPKAIEETFKTLGLDPTSIQSIGTGDKKSQVESSQLCPLHAADRLSIEFLSRGGKFLRPFITLASFDAVMLDGSSETSGRASLRESAKIAAIAIEVFHKASLVHDDIEDADEIRYGRTSLHVDHGIPTAINVGDYLLGLGYQIISLLPSPDRAISADVLKILSSAHVKLARGQGAELWWRKSAGKQLSVQETLEMYSLKTSPAFEAAIGIGVRLAGVIPEEAGPISRFASHVGIAFQILNDLKDWEGDLENARSSAGDFCGGRPTVLMAIAHERMAPEPAEKLSQIVLGVGAHSQDSIEKKIECAKQLLADAGVFTAAENLVIHHRQEASAAAALVTMPRFREVLEFLIEIAVPRFSSFERTKNG